MAEIGGKINYAGLKKVIQEMSKEFEVKIGLLAEQGGGETVSKDLDLAGLGAVQEFGATIKVTEKMRNFFRYKFGINLKKTTTEIKIPPRSFLYNPIVGNADALRKKIRNEIDKDSIEYILEYKDFEYLANIIAVAGWQQIREAFENGGFNGEWQPISEMTIANRPSPSTMPLVDTGYLKGRISFKVNKK